jgi:hypothetical protein
MEQARSRLAQRGSVIRDGAIDNERTERSMPGVGHIRSRARRFEQRLDLY